MGAPIRGAHFVEFLQKSIKRQMKIEKNMKKEPKYDLLLENNASKEFFIYSGLTDTSDNHLFYRFDTELDVPDGEYTYVVLINNRDDVVYDMNLPILETILHTGEGDVLLRDLQPSTGLLQIGEGIPVYENVYDETQDNNLIFYYDN